MVSQAMIEARGVKPDAKHGETASRLKTRQILALAVLAVSLGGCGNCNGWTNPWGHVGPHACESDHASESATAAIATE
jgi:hypothetical protein